VSSAPLDLTALDDFSDLNDLLADALSAQKEIADAKAAKDRQKRGGGSSQERAADAERIARWEAAHEWRAVANVALFHRFSCACGAHSTVFEQLMVRQQHRHLRDSYRWQLTKTAHAELPNEVTIRKTSSPVCPKCAESKGWVFSNITEWSV